MANARHPKPGTFLAVPLADGSFGYGRVLASPYIAFYAHRTPSPIIDLDDLESRPVLFCQAVRMRTGHWPVLGVRPLLGEVAKPVLRFMQDLANPALCTIFDSVGHERAATPQDCVGLERAAVWDPHHIEERLLDGFEGRPNATELRLRVLLPPFGVV